METWIEEDVAANVRIVAVMSMRQVRGRCPLRYMIEHDDHSNRGPFDSFEAALDVANRLTAAAAAAPGRSQPSVPKQAIGRGRYMAEREISTPATIAPAPISPAPNANGRTRVTTDTDARTMAICNAPTTISNNS